MGAESVKKSISPVVSDTISFLRFPCAVMVVFIHGWSAGDFTISSMDIHSLSADDVNGITQVLFSRVLSHIAVPTFFFISGYLFFNNLYVWNWKIWSDKILKRCKSLLIPYIIFNLAWIVWMAKSSALQSIQDGGDYLLNNLKQMGGIRMFWDSFSWEQHGTDLFGNALQRGTGPILFPLWFLRDLMFTILLSPIIFFLCRKIPATLLSVLCFAYFSSVSTKITGLSFVALFFFSAGSSFSLNQWRFILGKNLHIFYSVTLAFILLILAVLFNGNDSFFASLVYHSFVTSGVFAFINLSFWIVNQFHIRPNKFLTESCFFLFATHVMVLPYVKRFMEHTFDDSIVCYFLAIAITVVLCLSAYWILKFCLPKTTSFITGGGR